MYVLGVQSMYVRVSSLWIFLLGCIVPSSISYKVLLSACDCVLVVPCSGESGAGKTEATKQVPDRMHSYSHKLYFAVREKRSVLLFEIRDALT